MPDSVFASLLNTLDRRSISEAAHALREPEQAVSRGMETSVAALLSGITIKSQDPGTLHKVLDTVSSTGGEVSWSQMASGLTVPGSSVMTTGKQVLSTLFGSQENAVVNAISGASGLTLRAASILLPMAAPVVIGFLNRLVRDRGLNLSGLATLLQRESGTFRSALPAGLSELFWSGTGTMGTASPVVAQAVQKERTSNWVLPALAVAALALGLIWAFSHLHSPAARVGSVVGEANRLSIPAPKTVCTLPASINLPANGVASRLLAFVQNPDAKPEAITWFNTDQLSFDTGSATLRPESKAQLSNIATILTNCPSVRLSIAGYTDDVGSAPSNLRLSQNRADSVVTHLAGDGVSQDRLSAEGYGEEYPIADNDTAEGRARNRRVAIRVTDK